MATNDTSATLDNLLTTYLVKKAMPRLMPRVTLYEFAEKVALPQGGGSTTVRWNGFVNFLPISVTLSEGAANTLSSISSRKVEATVAQYGRGVQVSDLIVSTSSLPIIENYVMNLTDSAAISVDKIIQTGIFKTTMAQNAGTLILSNWLSSKASSFYGRAATGEESASAVTWSFPVVFGTSAARLSLCTNASTSAVASLFAVRKAVKALKWKNALPFADGFYKLIANSDFLTDIQRDPSFVDWYSYSGNVDVQEKGIASRGRIEQCKVYESNNLPVYRATTSCDLSIVMAQGAYGCTYIGEGKGYEIIVKAPNSYDSSNPFNQWTTISYKITMAAKALNVSCARILITLARP